MSKRGQDVVDFSADKAAALKLQNVSRETLQRLEHFVDLLLLWQQKMNLIAPSTIPFIWTRHVADSLQLLEHAPDAKIWLDFGSGGGFPAIPIACALAERTGSMVHLVESNGKKAAFLREAVRVTGVRAQVHLARAEKFSLSPVESVDVVTARALSPLKLLCDQAFPWIEKGALALFPKGQDIDAELTEATKYWTIEAEVAPSKTSATGCIVIVRHLHPVG
ncbi:MAG: 16S rRNA (guanine(527)-N(7))-methyltransferase RsmG [Pseudolabrys sp.]|nr:16S rRNA (guanine(527)-N(7))-methyltransferase RsmG [Pseudolabrys sp.]